MKRFMSTIPTCIGELHPAAKMSTMNERQVYLPRLASPGRGFRHLSFLFFSDRLPLTTEEIRLFCRVDFRIYTRQGCPCNSKRHRPDLYACSTNIHSRLNRRQSAAWLCIIKETRRGICPQILHRRHPLPARKNHRMLRSSLCVDRRDGQRAHQTLERRRGSRRHRLSPRRFCFRPSEMRGHQECLQPAERPQGLVLGNHDFRKNGVVHPTIAALDWYQAADTDARDERRGSGRDPLSLRHAHMAGQHGGHIIFTGIRTAISWVSVGVRRRRRHRDVDFTPRTFLERTRGMQ